MFRPSLHEKMWATTKTVLGDIDVMGQPMAMWRPKCCGCNERAKGRICYAGLNDNVVDNPYCGACFGEVFKQTKQLIATVHSGKVESEMVLIQNWKPTQFCGDIPRTIAELLTQGQKLSEAE